MNEMCRQLISIVIRQSPGPLGEDTGVMRMLFVQNDINLDTANTKYSRTPLLWATEMDMIGCEDAIAQCYPQQSG